MVSGEQAIVNQLCKLVDEFTEVKKLLRASEDRIIDVFYVTVPEAGGTRSFSVGITKIDFKTGAIINPDGTIDTLTRRLDLTQDKDFMHSISIHSDHDVKFRLDSAGQQSIDAQFLFQLPYVTYTTLEIECTAATEISIFACTNPQATLGNFKVSDMTQQTILGDGVELDTFDSITSLLSNLNRIRYQIKILSGEANWDDVPDTDLASIGSVVALHEADTSVHGAAEVADKATVSTEIDNDISTHGAVSTNIHGVGVGNHVASNDDIATHEADTSVHGVAEVADKATVSTEIDNDIATHEADASVHGVAEVRINVALNAFRIAVNGSLTRFNLQDGVIDDFQDDSGIFSGGVSGGILIPSVDLSLTVSSEHSDPYDETELVDENPATYWQSAAAPTQSITATYTGAVELSQYTLQAAPDAQNAPKTWTVLGSNTGAFGGEEETIDTNTDIVFANAEIKTYYPSQTIPYKYYKINITASKSGEVVAVAELTIGYISFDIVSNKTVAESQPSSVYIVVLADDTVITLNTDLKMYASVDDGATWEQTTLEDSGDFSATSRILTGSIIVVGTGTDIKYKIECTDPDFEFYAVGLLWD